MSQTSAPRALDAGIAAATSAYLVWGLVPLYWKLLERVPFMQILAHRALWCAVLVWLYLQVKRQAGWWRGASRKLMLMLAASTVLLTLNWALYIWAVNSGHIVETSLGYFINPLVSVLFGVWFLRERLNATQWIAVASAALGVLWLTFGVGHVPWIALGLAVSFAIYGLIRKLAVVEPIHGLAIESVLMLPLAAAFLVWCEWTGTGSFAHEGLGIDLLLVAGGLITAVPLAAFAYGARRVPLSTMGFLQYMAPTLQLIIGVFVFHEPFDAGRAVAFGLIWFALALYSLDGLRQYVQSRRALHAAD